MNKSRRPFTKTLEQLPIIRHSARIAMEMAWNASPKWFLGLVGMGILGSLMLAVQAWIARELINRIVAEISVESPAFEKLGVLLVLGFFTALFEALSNIIREYMTRRFEDDIRVYVNLQVFRHAATMDVATYDHPQFYDVLQRAQRNMPFHVSNFLNNWIHIFTYMLEIVSIILILIVIDPLILIVMPLIAIPYVLFYWRQGAAQYELDKKRTPQERLMLYYQRMLLTREYIAEIQLLRLSSMLIRQYEKWMNDFIEQDRRIYTRRAVGGFGFASLFTLVFYIALSWVSWRAIRGFVTVGDIAIYARVGLRLRDNIMSFSGVISYILADALYISDLDEFLKSEPFLLLDGERQAADITGNITFSDVSFQYPGTDMTVLHNLNLEIHAGEVVAIVGQNGAGKSTLAKLVARFFDPTQGQILLDGHPLSEYDLDSLHRQMAFVFQDTQRYEATVRDNIAYADWDTLHDDLPAIQLAAQRANIQDMIDAIPQGYDNMLGRIFGTYDLSGGQWQKLAIARAFARSGKIFILDEPTSNLDAIAEYEIFLRLRELAENATTVIISHRFSTVSMADRIIVLDEGKIVEQGTHQDLMALDGKYATMYRLQQVQLTP